ncbi:hypothetical protein CCH79_00018602 [Gambusia affinis]|uniref:Uncharacterized protein n=1 Tax=Gambusia affinis TaxID=33528 RepID=A0A315VJS1_GAMAF|nr:hypothetical protein CCH79_00018602 [Gambusia affinis]
MALGAKCKAIRLRISTSKSKKRAECLLGVKEDVLPQVVEFKYFRILFRGKMSERLTGRLAVYVVN